MFAADVGNKMKNVMEACTQQAADNAHEDTEDTPADNKEGVILSAFEMIEPCHRIDLFFL